MIVGKEKALELLVDASTRVFNLTNDQVNQLASLAVLAESGHLDIEGLSNLVRQIEGVEK